uniref:sulfotransferase domain-containing protein n=1 Tax=Candidatus Electrothrix sp. TaxID=2170559 RepID=UPI0040570E21
MAKNLKNIIWLASYPKSGNTWFRVFLSNLLSKGEGQVNINELLSTPVASSRTLIDEHTGVSSADLTQKEVDDMLPEVYRKLAVETDEKMFLKVHDAWRRSPSGISVFPPEVTAAVIYFIRNPLDVAVSYSYHTGQNPLKVIELMNNTEYSLCSSKNKMYSQIMQPLSDWSGHIKSWVDDSKLPVLVIRYEDMVENTFITFKKAVLFAGIDKDDDAIKSALEASDINKLQKLEQEEGFREKPLGMKYFFRRGFYGNWREHLEEINVKDFIKAHKTFMERYGYISGNRITY